MRAYKLLLLSVLLINLIVGCKQTAIEVSSVSLNTSTIEMVEGDNYSLVATVLPNNAVYDGISWASSNTSVASVNQGTVTALKEGKTTITASAGGKSATCSVTVSAKYIAVTSITLDKSELSLKVGSSDVITATVNPDDATDKSVKWSSSDASIVKVDNGKVTALKSGTATITATAGNCSAECVVTASIDTESITLDKSEISLSVGESATLTATVTPADATDQNITWTSSNPDIASVENGTVKALKAGTSTITAECSGKKAECTVTVTIPVSGISLDKTELTIEVGKTATLTATVTPADASDKVITWTSSNPDIASVENGTVKALKSGITTIAAECSGKKAECKVTVIVPVSGISLDKTELTIEEGKTATLKATITPSDATDQDITWTSSNNGICTVSNGIITAVKEGKATITASAGGKSATCSVTVSVKYIAVTSITLDKSELSLKVGSSDVLTATVKPDDATDKSVQWSSSDASIAKVDNGKVTALKSGTATITAECGGKKAECKVTVTVPVTGISLDKTELTIEVGKTTTLTATVTPADASDKVITWTSSNPDIASVENGTVKALKAGTSTITAECSGKKAECTVTVIIPVSGITLSHAEISLNVGETAVLTVAITPVDAAIQDITWTSSNPDIATVNHGTIRAQKGGLTTITAECGGKKAECVVTVIVPVTAITLDKSTLSIFAGSSKQLKATITPEDATDKDVSWETSNSRVVTVDALGKVTAITRGQATITAKCGDCSASCEVTVKGDEDLDLGKDVWMEMTGTSVIISGRIYYGRIYRIHNDSPVKITLTEIGTSNFQSIGKDLESGGTYDFTLYFYYQVFPKITLKFKYNNKSYEVYLENYAN